jgi:hypothetical protein
MHILYLKYWAIFLLITSWLNCWMFSGQFYSSTFHLYPFIFFFVVKSLLFNPAWGGFIDLDVISHFYSVFQPLKLPVIPFFSSSYNLCFIKVKFNIFHQYVLSTICVVYFDFSLFVIIVIFFDWEGKPAISSNEGVVIYY